MYRQITFAERYTLGLLRQCGLAPAAIARVLGRHRSTVLREVQRNSAHSDATYRPQLADWYARGRRSRSCRNRRFSPTGWEQIQARLREDWSPEQVAGRLRLLGRLRISHEKMGQEVPCPHPSGASSPETFLLERRNLVSQSEPCRRSR